MNKLLTAVFTLISLQTSVAQLVPFNSRDFNQHSAKGHRIGKWIILYTPKRQETSNIDSAGFYRQVTFDAQGKPVGLIKDNYLSGHRFWEGKMTQLEPVEMMDGPVTWFFDNGQKARTGTYHNGQQEGWFLGWKENGQLAIRTPFHHGVVNGINTVWRSPYDSTNTFYEMGERMDLDKLHFQIVQLTRNKLPKDALAAAEKAAYIAELTLPKVDSLHAIIFLDLGYLYTQTGQNGKALPAYLKAYSITKQIFPQHHLTYRLSIMNLADVYEATGKYEHAIPLYTEAQTIYLKNSVEQAYVLSRLGSLYGRIGQYEKSIPMFQSALTIYEQKNSQADSSYVNMLNNFGWLYQSMGLYEEALPLYHKALTSLKQMGAVQKINYVAPLQNLASLYEAMGQGIKALDYYQEALILCERELGQQHPTYATILLNLGELYASKKLFGDAMIVFEKAMAIHQADTLHPDYATGLSRIATVCQGIGEYEKALILFKRVSNIVEKRLGNKHPLYAIAIGNIAFVYAHMGEYIPALTGYSIALRILDNNKSTDYAKYTSILINQITLLQQIKWYDKAIPLMIYAHQIYKTQLLRSISVLDEVALIQFQQRFDNADLGYSIGYKIPVAEMAGLSYNAALLSKGIGLLATQQLTKLLTLSKDTVTNQLVFQLRLTRNLLKDQYSLPFNQQQHIDSLERRVDNLMQALILRLPGYGQAFSGLNVDWKQIQRHLKPNEASIEFVSFRYRQQTVTDSILYIALLIRPHWASPKLVFLSEEKQLSELLSRNSNNSQQRINTLYTNVANIDILSRQREGKLAGNTSTTNSLYDLLWQPIAGLLRGVQRVYYSPSGLLHRINLAALPVNSHQRLSDRHQLVLLTSTRQLALPVAHRKQNDNALLLGNVNYSLDTVVVKHENTQYQRQALIPRQVAPNSGSRFWGKLKQSGREIQEIATLLSRQQYKVNTLVGHKASEEALRFLLEKPSGSPRIVHLATHGFFNESPAIVSVNSSPNDFSVSPAFINSKNPLIRSGLLLAGANSAWQGKLAPADSDDGVLTAYEISMRTMNQTELVVLSACETGLGDIHDSEGVYGLQRAFKMAGVDNIIMSLWKVDDTATGALMTRFYEYYVSKPGLHSIHSAFQSAIHDLRQQWPQPYYWAGFVLVE